jgi:hypothetical protein
MAGSPTNTSQFCIYTFTITTHAKTVLGGILQLVAHKWKVHELGL